MAIRDTHSSYGLITRGLHWVLFVLITMQLLLALLFTDLFSGSAQQIAMWLHESLGLLIFVLGVVFVAWRLKNPRPSLARVPAWQRGAAFIVHALIYVAIVVQPIVGILMSFGFGFTIPFFGLFTVPVFIPVGNAAGNALMLSHVYVGVWVIPILLGGHIAAALYHRFGRRDDVLKRMWSGRGDS
ncbi:cytochrome b [Salinisphaera sp. USBA-960]|nr:cytochrome b [Salifodinibacter halophilus]NNC27206.1 cytochrome b [Salifodinibacter halophilus]